MRRKGLIFLYHAQFSGTASDRDSGLNGELTFSISNSTNFDVKTLPNKSFAIIVKRYDIDDKLLQN